VILQVGVTAIAIRQSCSFDVHALPEALVAIRDGKMAATVDQYPSRQARGALDIIVAYLREGKQPEPAVVHVCTEYDTNTVQHVYDRQRLRQTAQTAPDGEVLTHEVTTRWLNDVYQRFTDAEQERFEKVSTLFRIHIQQLQPYHSVRITEKALDKLYNTVDAVPQSFADEYRTLLDGGRWLDARMLLVPVAVTDRRLSSMRSGDYLINRPYDEELGLL